VPTRYLVPAGPVEEHILALIRSDLAGLRNDAELLRQVEEQLARASEGQSDARPS